jgi:diacylglycerol kinase (ATP)
MPHEYSHICIIYNPKSTSGRAELRAKRLSRQLTKRQNAPVKLHATEQAGHAEELAYSFACKHAKPLIISVSGDGGYNEVVNGVLRAIDEGKAGQPVCAIRAAGNANDHYRSVQKQKLITAITKRPPVAIDVLRLQIGDRTTRYAHSYIGLGPTALAAKDLNQEKLNRMKEMKIVLRALFNFNHFFIKKDGQIIKLDSLLFSNIKQMSKVIRLNENADPYDGKFDEIAHKHEPRWKFIITLLRILIFGVKSPPQHNTYQFVLLTTSDVHLDGEPINVKAHSKMSVSAVTHRLYTIK